MDKNGVFRYLKHTAIMCVSGVLLASAYLGLAYWRDPLFLFHPSEGNTFHSRSNMRILAAGIINSMEFDSAIVGTSVMENSSCADAEKALGGRFMNVSIAGCLFNERSVVLRYMLANKDMKRVVYSLDRYYHLCSTEGYPPRYWHYLYDDNAFNDIKVYTDTKYLRSVLFGNSPRKGITLDRPKSWVAEEYHTCRFGGLKNWVGNIEKQGLEEFLTVRLPGAAMLADPQRELVQNKEKEAQAVEYMEKYIFSITEQYPQTEFLFVFPPYWRYHFAEKLQTDPEQFVLHQNIVRHVVQRAKVMGNARVFGFENCSFLDDIAFYKDVTHYSEDINAYITESLGKGHHELTPDNVEAYLSRCEELARAFDIKGLNEKVKAMLAEKK